MRIAFVLSCHGTGHRELQHCSCTPASDSPHHIRQWLPRTRHLGVILHAALAEFLLVALLHVVARLVNSFGQFMNAPEPRQLSQLCPLLESAPAKDIY